MHQPRWKHSQGRCWPTRAKLQHRAGLRPSIPDLSCCPGVQSICSSQASPWEGRNRLQDSEDLGWGQKGLGPCTGRRHHRIQLAGNQGALAPSYQVGWEEKEGEQKKVTEGFYPIQLNSASARRMTPDRSDS